MQEVKILLVEDNRADARFVEEAFKRSDWNVRITTVEDGDLAMDYLYRRGNYAEAVQPDFVLLDLNLPRMDGHAVLAQIKREPELRRTPVVVLTSSTSANDIQRSYDNHANAYVVKPIGLAKMSETVSAIQDFWIKTSVLPTQDANKTGEQ